MKRIVNGLGKLHWRKMARAVVVVLGASTALRAQTVTTLGNFDGVDGEDPVGTLVQGADGDFYGATFRGGIGGRLIRPPRPYGVGTIFKITPDGTLTTLYNFCLQVVAGGCPDGEEPWEGLVLGASGDLFGTTPQTIFEITPSGTLTTLHSFYTTNDQPAAELVLAANGDFYGTSYAENTVFKITPSGALTTLHTFCTQNACLDGASPEAGLVQATDGNFYGTTAYRGAYQGGTVFTITPTGTLTTLYSFCSQSGCTDGELPVATLIQASNGDFYATTLQGGSTPFCPEGCGTIFKITPGGSLTTLYNFCSQSGCTDGYGQGPLVQATNGDLYGTTQVIADSALAGTIFKMTLEGKLTTIYTFSLPPNGGSPLNGLFQATDGDLYGTTDGGIYGAGSIFRLSVGLGPFVKTQPTAGQVGAAVEILGTNLAGASRVTFNGTPAVFGVSTSQTEITATVPAGATSGKVEVVTPNGTLSSNVPFQVRP